MRLFVALALPDAVAQSIMLIQGGVPGARWQSREQLHLTLRFIGEVDGREAAMLDDVLAGIAAPAFGLQLHGAGQFGNKEHRPGKVGARGGARTGFSSGRATAKEHRPGKVGARGGARTGFSSGRATVYRAHALWAGARPNAALEHLQKKVDAAIRRVGTPQDAHKFTPHVTVARMRNPENAKVVEWLTCNALYTGPEFQVGAFCLYSSRLTGDGSVYAVEQEYSLEGAYGEIDD